MLRRAPPLAPSRRRHILISVAAMLALSACAVFLVVATVPHVIARVRGAAGNATSSTATTSSGGTATAAAARDSEWVVELAADADPLLVAREHNMVYRGVLQGLRGFHRFEQLPPQHASARDGLAVRSIAETARRAAAKRDAEAQARLATDGVGVSSVARAVRGDESSDDGDADDLLGVVWAEQQAARKRFTRAVPVARAATVPLATPGDPLYGQQWHLSAAGVAGAGGAWAQGVRGRGVLVSVVDDGLAFRHPDLAPRYVAAASRDVNGRAAEPTERNGDAHGTQAAGVAVASENHDCGVGAAPLAALAGVRILGAPASDADEAEALITGLQLSGVPATAQVGARGVSIYSCSWGPYDDAKRMEAPQRLTQLAIERGIREGRAGRGVIYAWASGNGHDVRDSCSYDGYASSRYVLTVGAVGRHGKATYYGESCPALLVVAPSSDNIDFITTSMAPTGCTSRFSGTSAAAPLVAGVMALALEAREDLTWRDVQLLLARTATRNDPAEAGWRRNGAGLWTSPTYGFGTLNASALVAAARTWRLVGPASVSETPLMLETPVVATARPGAPITLRVAVAAERVIESVELDVDIAVAQRGALTLTLTAPSGLQSTFMEPHQDSGRDLPAGWRFTSRRHMGESSRGLWTLTLSVAAAGTVPRAPSIAAAQAQLRSWRLRFHGTAAP